MATHFHSKVAQIFLVYSEKTLFLSKVRCGYVLGIFGQTWATFFQHLATMHLMVVIDVQDGWPLVVETIFT